MPGFIIGGAEANIEGVSSNTVETHRQHRWRIIKLGPIDFSLEFLVAQSFQLPNVNIEVQEIKAALLTYKFAKAVNWDNASVTFYDALPTLDRLETLWRNKVYSNEDGIKSHKDYKFDTIIELLDGAGKATIKFILKRASVRS